jgi:O-antigen/teichoic acid export membrane protein
MNILSIKNILRLKLIVAGALFRVLSSLSSALVSLTVIRQFSTDLWGQVVYFILLQDLCFSLINWGSSSYLDYQFSHHPNHIKKYWNNSIISRSVLLFLFLIIIIFLNYETEVSVLFSGWCIARFIYQSFEPIAQFERNFIFLLVIEIAGLLIIIIPVLLRLFNIDLQMMLILYFTSFTSRAALSSIYFKNYCKSIRSSISFNEMKYFFKAAFPFLILTFSAMLQQRADIYITTLYLTESETAQYQVFINLLLFGQVGASLLLSPFSKNIFRLPAISIKRLENQFMFLGIFLSLITILFISLIITIGYHFQFSFILYVLGYIYILMFYLYLIRIYILRKTFKQLTIALYSFIGCGVNLTVSFLLIPRYAVIGAMLAGAATQISMTILFHKVTILKNLKASLVYDVD